MTQHSNAAGRVVYVNGKFVPEAEACVSIFDSALMFGDMAFEFTRTFAHKPFRLRQHLERLYASMRVLRIDSGMTVEQMEQATEEVLRRTLPDLGPDLDVQILHEASRGILSFYDRVFEPARAGQPTVIIGAYPLDVHQGRMADAYNTGIKAVIPQQRAIPSRMLDPKLKTRSRQHYMIANLQAQDTDPHAWALLVDEHGCLAEGTGANVFIVKDGALLTPEPRNILRGVSRGMVIDLAAKLGIPCRECDLEPYDMHQADEAFFTSTPFCLLSVSHLNGQPIGEGRPGPVARRLLDAWGREVGVDIVQQAEGYRSRLRT